MSRTLQTWTSPPELPTLAADEVHVWRVSLDPGAAIVEIVRPLLSSTEQNRAQRFRHLSDGDRFTVGRAYLRIILGRYLQTDAGEIQFRYGEYGKPLLFAEKSTDLEFNLAHSDGSALYAFTRSREIGVDLERIKPGFSDESIAQTFFSENEVMLLDAVNAQDRDEAFFNCWALKEAFIKAKGLGLSLPLDQFDVALSSRSSLLLRTRWDEEEAHRWTLKTIELGSDYVGAIAVGGNDFSLKCFKPGEGFLTEFFRNRARQAFPPSQLS